MASFAHLSREERLGLGIAAAAHVALVAALYFQTQDDPTPLPIPERMTVSLASEVSLESTAPDPAPEAQAAVAPVLAPEPAPAPEPRPQPQPQPTREPITRPTVAPTPRPTARPTQRPTPAPTQKAGGGSRVGADFLQGAGSSEKSNERAVPASQIGASERASLRQAVNRQLKPNWQPPQGVDAEKLVTVVRFRLNRDGTLAGPPELIGQTQGQTDSNRVQVPRHRELALRAVRLTAPFDLPDQYYEAWKTITVNFNYELSQ